MFGSVIVLFAVVLQVVLSLRLTPFECSSLISAINGGYIDECLPIWVLSLRQAKNSVESHPLCKSWVTNSGRDGFVDIWAKKYLESVCSNSISDKRACSNAVWQTVEKLMATNLDPTYVCYLLKPPYHLTQAMDLWVQGSKVDVVDGKVYVAASAVSCGTCTYVMGRVKYLLGQQFVEQTIEAFLYRACRWLGESEPQCNTIIRTDVPALIRWLEHDLSPHSMCHFLRFCEPTEEEKVAPLCPFCSYVMDRVKIELNQENTIEQIEAVTRAVCVRVSHWNNVCQEIVEINVPMLMRFLSAHMDSRYICKKLHACPSCLNETIEVALRTKTTCLLCKPVVYTVKLILKQNGTVSEIEAVLDKFCTLLKSDMCKEMVVAYIPEIVQLLERNANPETVCELLGLCDPKNNEANLLVYHEQPPARLCPLCLLILGTIKKENEKDSSFANIARSLSRICPMTKALMSDCRTIISGNERTIALELSQDEDERSICELINVCNAQTVSGDIFTNGNSGPAKTISDGTVETKSTPPSQDTVGLAKFRASTFGAFGDVLRFRQRGH